MELDAMVTFIGMLMCGAVAGFMMEQQWGSNLLRWARQHRMRMRVLRRQGDNPLRAWFDEED
jgi:hypothetical protein